MKKSKAKKKMGRPPKPAGEKKNPALGIRLTAAEHERLRRNAAAAGRNVAAHIVARCCG